MHHDFPATGLGVPKSHHVWNAAAPHFRSRVGGIDDRDDESVLVRAIWTPDSQRSCSQVNDHFDSAPGVDYQPRLLPVVTNFASRVEAALHIFCRVSVLTAFTP